MSVNHGHCHCRARVETVEQVLELCLSGFPELRSPGTLGNADLGSVVQGLLLRWFCASSKFPGNSDDADSGTVGPAKLQRTHTVWHDGGR